MNVTRPLNAVTQNQPYLWNGKLHELETWFTVEYDDLINDTRVDLKGQRSMSSSRHFDTCLSTTRQSKVAEEPKLAERLSVQRVILSFYYYAN